MKNLNTKIFEIDKNNIDTNKIREAAVLLKEGGLVAFPTETVYGLGGNALSESTVNKIFKAKGRPGDNPLIVHIYSVDQLENLALEIPKGDSKRSKNANISGRPSSRLNFGQV